MLRLLCDQTKISLVVASFGIAAFLSSEGHTENLRFNILIDLKLNEVYKNSKQGDVAEMIYRTTLIL